MFQNAMKVQPKKTLHPKLRAMRIDACRKALGIKPESHYTSQEAFEKAADAEAAFNDTEPTHFNNRSFYAEARRNWLELSALLEEEEQEAARVSVS